MSFKSKKDQYQYLFTTFPARRLSYASEENLCYLREFAHNAGVLSNEILGGEFVELKSLKILMLFSAPLSRQNYDPTS